MQRFTAALAASAFVTAAVGQVDLSRVSVAGFDPNTGYTTLVLDFSGLRHYSSLGSPLNDRFEIPVGMGAEVVGLAMDVTVTTLGASRLDEALYEAEDLWEGFLIGPAVLESRGAVNERFVYDLFYFSDFALLAWSSGGDGVYTLELFETFVNNGGAGDLEYHGDSTVTLIVSGYVPSPSSSAMLGLAGLAATKRRRR